MATTPAATPPSPPTARPSSATSTSATCSPPAPPATPRREVSAGRTGAALPTKTYTDALTLEVKGRSAALKHPANAHTGGDTYVFFTDANVLSTGDTFTNGRYPNIDF